MSGLHLQAKNWLFEKDCEKIVEIVEISNLDVNKRFSVFNETIMNIFENFVPHETITCNDRYPPWTNKQIAEKIALYKRLK